MSDDMTKLAQITRSLLSEVTDWLDFNKFGCCHGRD
jgi:hypothetical protein